MIIKEHFHQIQTVLNKITENKELSDKFKEKQSEEDRFNFTLDLCKTESLDCDYTIEEFRKFDFFVNILCELEKNPNTSKKFQKAKDADQIYNLILTRISNKNNNIDVSKEDFKVFVDSISSKIKQISQKGLTQISGGKSNESDLSIRFLEYPKEFNLYYTLGQFLGQYIKSVRDVLNND